ncbi:VOC family protein [Flavicella sediminum]|uniref:VOC family protein n=1 Tax=Flavicella sediminum TaxID=2585141 RepID=UPI00111E95DA|nr:VOC family protein [Flavicella sediminum]
MNFHISLPCTNLEETKKFYTQTLGAALGRSASNWLDINLYGNQLTFNKSGKFNFEYPSYTFEKEVLPSFHFGVILENNLWSDLYEKLQSSNIISKTDFLKNKTGAHSSFFIKDPNGYIIEFKTFTTQNTIFSNT